MKLTCLRWLHVDFVKDTLGHDLDLYNLFLEKKKKKRQGEYMYQSHQGVIFQVELVQNMLARGFEFDSVSRCRCSCVLSKHCS